MQKSKLFEILQAFNHKAFVQFDALVRSNFIKIGNDGLVLLTYLFEHDNSNKFVGSHFDKIIVQNKLFGSGKKGDAALRRAMYNLKTGVEEFLALEELKSNPYLQQKLIQRNLEGKNLFHQADRIQKNKIAVLKRNFATDDFYFYESYLLHAENYFSPYKEIVNQDFSLLELAMKNLDAFYFLGKFKLAAEMFERQMVLGDKFEVSFIELCLNEANLRLNSQDPSFILYKYLVEHYFYGYDPKKYTAALQLLFSKLNQISREDQFRLFLYFQNIMIRNHKNGDQSAIKVIHENYIQALKTKLLLDQGNLRATTFLNIVITACVAKQLKWVKRFIEKEGGSLLIDKESMANILIEARIHYNFHLGEFHTVRDLFIQFKFPRNFYSFRMKAILLQTYYEQLELKENTWELLDYEIENFYRYVLKAKKTSSTKATGFKNFINIFKRLLSQKKKGKINPDAKRRLLENVEQKSELPLKQWLIAKIRLI